MKEVYFDTNVYGHIYRRQHRITGADIKKLENAIRDKQLRIFTSFAVVEETNIARLSSLDEANGRLELIRTLCVKEQIIKHHSDLLDDDLKAYANGDEPPDRLQPPYPRFSELFWDHTRKNYKRYDGFAKDSLHRICEFSEDMNKRFKKIRAMADKIKHNNQQQPFPDYWREMSLPWVEQVADKYGVLRECKKRGLKRLLKVQSIRLNTIAQMSLTYANTYRRTTFDTGNSRDMHHVVCASAVPIFVTHDKRLKTVLETMPTPGLQVMDIHALLKLI
jgi:hypothetical protein